MQRSDQFGFMILLLWFLLSENLHGMEVCGWINKSEEIFKALEFVNEQNRYMQFLMIRRISSSREYSRCQMLRFDNEHETVHGCEMSLNIDWKKNWILIREWWRDYYIWKYVERRRSIHSTHVTLPFIITRKLFAQRTTSNLRFFILSFEFISPRLLIFWIRTLERFLTESVSRDWVENMELE